MKTQQEKRTLWTQSAKELVHRMNCYQKLATILVFKTHLQSIGLELKALTPTKTENKTTKILFELRFHGKLHFYQLSPKKKKNVH